MTCWCCRLLIAAVIALSIALIVGCGVPLIEIACALYPNGM
jgi:hypothetical protein